MTALKTLETLLKIQKNKIDTLAQKKSGYLAQLTFLAQEKKIILETLDKERRAAYDISSMQTFTAFEKQVYEKVRVVDNEEKRVHTALNTVTKEFEEAYHVFKAQELVVQKTKSALKSEEQKQENAMLDEAGLQKFYMTEG